MSETDERVDERITEELRKFLEITEKFLDDEGLGMSLALLVGRDGERIMMALDLTPEQTYVTFFAQIFEVEPSEAFLVMDRYAAPGQGTTLNDLLTIVHYRADDENRWGTLIVEYDKTREAGKTEKPCYDNEFWNNQIMREMLHAAI